MVSFRGQKKLGPRPGRCPLWISDEHPHPFHIRSPPTPPPPGGINPHSLVLTALNVVSLLD